MKTIDYECQLRNIVNHMEQHYSLCHSLPQHTAEGQPQRSRALPLEQRFARIEAEILRFLGC